MKKFAYAMVALAAILFIFTGCNLGGSNSTASGGVTLADLAALKAQLRTQVVQTAPFHAASTARTEGINTGVTAVPAATTVASTSLGTSCGDDAPFPRTTQKCIVDSQGVSVIVPYPSGGAYAEMYPVFYSSVNCTVDVNGNGAYVQFGPSTLNGIPSVGGVVFRVDPASKGALDASTYFHISSTTVTAMVNPQSESQGDGQCVATSFVSPVSMVPISAGVSGTWAASPTGPLAAGIPN